MLLNYFSCNNIATVFYQVCFGYLSWSLFRLFYHIVILKFTTYLYMYLPTHTSVSLPMPLLIIPVIGSLNPTLVWFNHKKILTICFMAPEMVNFLPYQQVTYFTLLCQENQWIHLKTLRSRLFLWKNVVTWATHCHMKIHISWTPQNEYIF